ncbi:hypothetical protein HDU67_000252 [Dinochytrium kinnereticum]|nr:hypothetical protein HDU67_000252 [Dinochytrium kinnereticum]
MVNELTEERAVAACRQLQSTAWLAGARFLPGASTVECAWSYKNIDANASSSLTTFHSVEGDTLKPSGIPPVPSAGGVLSVLSADGLSRAIIKKTTPEKGEAATEYIEILRVGSPAVLISLADVCGDAVKGGSLLSSAAFNSDGSLFAFAAKAKKPKSTPFFNKAPATSGSQGEDAAQKPAPRGEEYDHEPDWGEGLLVVRSVMVLVDIANGTASELSGLDASYTWAQIEWHPKNPKWFLAVGFPNEDQRQGLLHFNTRRSHLFQGELGSDLTVNAKQAKLDFNCHNVLWPRFSPDGSHFVFLTTDNVLYHVSCSKLVLANVDNESFTVSSSSVIVDVVQSPETLDGFYGLWPRAIVQPRRIWLDNSHVCFASQERARFILLIVSISGKVQRFYCPELPGFEGGSLDLLDVTDGSILVRIESPLSPPCVMLAKIVTVNGAASVVWPTIPTLVSSPSPLPKENLTLLASATAKILTVNKEVDVIVLLPPEVNSSTRLVLYPHGGPHGAFTTFFSSMNSYFLSLGYALAMVNFRGSCGYGQHCIEALPGYCGEYDVEDCILASKATFAAFPTLNPDKQVVMGGSHGGFLCLWLIAKYPDMFKSAVARNPVANIAHMMSITDIPDWCAVECGVRWDIKGVPTAEDYHKMYLMSPISQIEKVKTPLMLCLGDADKRVPMSQSLDYYRVLKSRGVKSRCVVYPGSTHSLTDRVDSESNNWVSIALWLSQ